MRHTAARAMPKPRMRRFTSGVMFVSCTREHHDVDILEQKDKENCTICLVIIKAPKHSQYTTREARRSGGNLGEKSSKLRSTCCALSGRLPTRDYLRG